MFTPTAFKLVKWIAGYPLFNFTSFWGTDWFGWNGGNPKLRLFQVSYAQFSSGTPGCFH